MSLPQFDPQKTLSNLRSARQSRAQRNDHALEQVEIQAAHARDEVRTFVNKAMAWVGSELSSEGVSRSYAQSRKEGLDENFVNSLSSHLQAGLRQLRQDEVKLSQGPMFGQDVSRALLKDYLLEVAMPDAMAALSPAALSEALGNLSDKALVESVRSKMVDQVVDAARFLANHASSPVVQGVASGTAEGLVDAIRCVGDPIRPVRLLKDHARFIAKSFGGRPPREVEFRQPTSVPVDEGLLAAADQFLTDVTKHERPFVSAVGRRTNEILAKVEYVDGKPKFRMASPPERRSLMDMFRRR